MNNKTTLEKYQKFNSLPFHIERFCPEEPIQLHYHDCVELIFCTGGVCLNNVEDFCFQMRRNNIFTIGGRAAHSLSGFKDFTGFRILFDMSMLDSLEDDIKTTTGYTTLFLLNESGYINHVYRCCISIVDKYFDRLVCLMEDLLCEYETESVMNEKYIKSLFCTICIFIVKCFEAKQHYTTKSFFEQAVAELVKHLNDDVGVKEIAASFGISEQYFRKIFAEHAGMSPIQLATDLRLRRAKSLLTCSDKSITEIAFSCGFYDSSHMLRTFKQYEGITPKEYRKKSRV